MRERMLVVKCEQKLYSSKQTSLTWLAGYVYWTQHKNTETHELEKKKINLIERQLMIMFASAKAN